MWLTPNDRPSVAARDGRFSIPRLLLHQNQQLDLSASGIDAISTLRQVADQLAGYLSKQYAVKNTGQTAGVQITVTGVKTLPPPRALEAISRPTPPSNKCACSAYKNKA